MNDKRWFLATGCITIALLYILAPSSAQEKKAKGRLPPYYGSIVNDQQRQAIYLIQAKYDQQLDALNEQLQALEKRRDAEIEGVLSPEQRLVLKKTQDEAALKRKKSIDEDLAVEVPAKIAPAEMKKPVKKTK
jgi:hypothetical protein